MYTASIIIPAFKEGEVIASCLRRIDEEVHTPCEVMVVCDFEEDPTLPFVREFRMNHQLSGLVNTYGRGPANAIRYGMDHSTGKVVVVTMADGSDDVGQIDELVSLVQAGAAVAVASRYAKGGRQLGGPAIKKMISKTAGLTLAWSARVGTRDATNSFKAYSREFLEAVGVESDSGFEIGIELVAKARRLRLPVVEIPTVWKDRTDGQSNFQVAAWIPRYLRWYRYAFGPRLTPAEIRERAKARS